MSYFIKKSDGSTIQIPELSIDNSTNIKIIGRGLPQYGEPIAESMVRMLENFASDTAPGSTSSAVDGDPLTGQLWYDSGEKILKYYDGDRFVSIIDEDDNLGGSTAITADRLSVPRTIALTGNVTGSAQFDGSSNISIYTTVDPSLFTNDDGSSNFNPFTLSLTGDATGSASINGTSNVSMSVNVVEASKLSTPRTIALSGAVSGSAQFDGSGNISIFTIGEGQEVEPPSAEIAYPVGSIYLSMNSTNPSTSLGFGTWARLRGKMLLGVDESTAMTPRIDAGGLTGGSYTHNHGDGNLATNSAGSHYHPLPTGGWGAVQSATGHLPEPTVEGLLITGSGKSESQENMESMAHAEGTRNSFISGAHTHTITGNTDFASTLPPFITVYMWYRTQ